MIRVLITVRPAGLPAQRYPGIYKTTTDAALAAMDRLGERPGSVSVKAVATGSAA
jgi:hypothetical protein